MAVAQCYGSTLVKKKRIEKTKTRLKLFCFSNSNVTLY